MQEKKKLSGPPSPSDRSRSYDQIPSGSMHPTEGRPLHEDKIFPIFVSISFAAIIFFFPAILANPLFLLGVTALYSILIANNLSNIPYFGRDLPFLHEREY